LRVEIGTTKRNEGKREKRLGGTRTRWGRYFTRDQGEETITNRLVCVDRKGRALKTPDHEQH